MLWTTIAVRSKKANILRDKNPMNDTAPKKLTLEEIKERIKVVCICKGIKLGKIQDAINNGCLSQDAVNKATGSGNGGCWATRCGPVIREMIEKRKQEIEEA